MLKFLGVSTVPLKPGEKRKLPRLCLSGVAQRLCGALLLILVLLGAYLMGHRRCLTDVSGRSGSPLRWLGFTVKSQPPDQCASQTPLLQSCHNSLRTIIWKQTRSTF